VSEVPGVDEARGIKVESERVISGEVEYSQRFLEDWVALGAGHVSYAQGIIGTAPDTPGSKIIRYANIPAPVLVIGGDAELRREWRRGWMLSASYAYQRVQIQDDTLSNPRLVNVPEHLASVRGVVPVVREVASVGLRVTLEAPRRLSPDTDELTQTEVIADATISGEARPFGLRYVVGVYNIADRRVDVPVADTFRVSKSPQNGRTFLLEVVGTYP
jgi:outer membrane receptor protein involved in Fe transport